MVKPLPDNTLPASGGKSPASVLMNVDLPAPFMPSKPRRCPICSDRLMPETMTLLVPPCVLSLCLLVSFFFCCCLGFGAVCGSWFLFVFLVVVCCGVCFFFFV